MRTTDSSGGRQVQDGHYFYTKLSEKRSQLLEANEKLRKEIEDLQVSKPKSLQMLRRIEELSAEVKGLETQLQNYNLVIQKATLRATAADVQNEVAATQV